MLKIEQKYALTIRNYLGNRELYLLCCCTELGERARFKK